MTELCCGKFKANKQINKQTKKIREGFNNGNCSYRFCKPIDVIKYFMQN
jgi:hypothetical protein